MFVLCLRLQSLATVTVSILSKRSCDLKISLFKIVLVELSVNYIKGVPYCVLSNFMFDLT